MTANDATVSGPPAAAGGQGAARQAGARLRLAAVLAVLTCGLLASAAAVPAAFATMLPDKGPQPWAFRRLPPLSSRTSRVTPHAQAHARRSARAADTPPGPAPPGPRPTACP